MADIAPTHLLNEGDLPVWAARWHRDGDRPEDIQHAADSCLIDRRTPPRVKPFTYAVLRYRSEFHERDQVPHSEISGDAFIRNCTTPMGEHGWLPHPCAEPGTGWLLCPGDWLIIFRDGSYRGEADHRFHERYRLAV